METSPLPFTTLVLGASSNPERYSNRAILQLQAHGFHVIGIGVKADQIGNCHIMTQWPSSIPIHTVTVYLQPNRQADYLAELLQNRPNRVIFNPGTENPEIESQLQAAGIYTVHACTLVLLSTHQYEIT